MDTLTLLVRCAIMLGVIIWFIVKKWTKLMPENNETRISTGMKLISSVKTVHTNDGKIDRDAWKQICSYLVMIIAYLGDRTEKNRDFSNACFKLSVMGLSGVWVPDEDTEVSGGERGVSAGFPWDKRLQRIRDSACIKR